MEGGSPFTCFLLGKIEVHVGENEHHVAGHPFQVKMHKCSPDIWRGPMNHLRIVTENTYIEKAAKSQDARWIPRLLGMHETRKPNVNKKNTRICRWKAWYCTTEEYYNTI